jgi:hypothetical protein
MLTVGDSAGGTMAPRLLNASPTSGNERRGVSQPLRDQMTGRYSSIAFTGERTPSLWTGPLRANG